MTESRPEQRKDWRELCAAAAGELDSERLAALVNQIIEAIDEHHTLPKRLTDPRAPASPDVC
jgi:hypothetical protein